MNDLLSTWWEGGGDRGDSPVLGEERGRVIQVNRYSRSVHMCSRLTKVSLCKGPRWGWGGGGGAKQMVSLQSRADWGRTGGYGTSGLDMNPSSIICYHSDVGQIS